MEQEPLITIILAGAIGLILVLACATPILEGRRRRGEWPWSEPHEDEEKPAEPAPLSLLSPERRYQLWREELRAWTDEDGTQVGLGALLDRWRGVPHGKPGVEPRPVAMIGGWYGLETLDGAQTIVRARMDPIPSTAEAKPTFKVGQWVRLISYRAEYAFKSPRLGQVQALTDTGAIVSCPGGGVSVGYAEIEPAVPHVGEWWRKTKTCHMGMGYCIGEPIQIGKLGPCPGCVYEPVNFGRGEEAKG